MRNGVSGFDPRGYRTESEAEPTSRNEMCHG